MKVFKGKRKRYKNTLLLFSVIIFVDAIFAFAKQRIRIIELSRQISSIEQMSDHNL